MNYRKKTRKIWNILLFKYLKKLKFVSFIFYCSTNDSRSKTIKKCFLFCLKSSFRSRDIQIFAFPSSPFFLSVASCFRGWSKTNFKVHAVITYLNNNLITHFDWYLRKKKRYDIETLSINIVLNKKYFYGKIVQKICTKSQSQTPSQFW